jgi:hypothetical protein
MKKPPKQPKEFWKLLSLKKGGALSVHLAFVWYSVGKAL